MAVAQLGVVDIGDGLDATFDIFIGKLFPEAVVVDFGSDGRRVARLHVFGNEFSIVVARVGVKLEHPHPIGF